MARMQVGDGLHELLVVARRLRDRDPDRFMRILALARAYIAIYEPGDEASEIASAQLQRVVGIKADA